jgi:hypothetical protein
MSVAEPLRQVLADACRRGLAFRMLRFDLT